VVNGVVGRVVLLQDVDDLRLATRVCARRRDIAEVVRVGEGVPVQAVRVEIGELAVGEAVAVGPS
jgi:hypothetical protein